MLPLSIIIPVYNKEQYVSDCIESVINQTFTNFELILVNDGSTDNSYQKCLEYAAKDSRIRVIDQQNAGVSEARNAGLKVAGGEYVGFIDSDDTIENNMYTSLMDNAVKINADVSVCSMRVIFPYKTVSTPEDEKVTTMDRDAALSAFLKGKLEFSANNKVIKRSIAGDIRFEGRIYEDILYMSKVFLAAKCTIFQPVMRYNYIVRSNSASMSAFGAQYQETVKVSAKIVELVNRHSPANQDEAMAFDVSANISLLNLLIMAREKDKPVYGDVSATLKKYDTFIRNAMKVRSKHKYAYLLYSFSPRFYAGCMYIYCRLTKSEVLKRTQNQ